MSEDEHGPSVEGSGPEDEVCAHCGGEIPGDEVTWIKENGDVALNADEGGEPYHEGCAP